MAKRGLSGDTATTWPRRAMRGSFVDRYLALSQDDGRSLSSLSAAVLDANATLLGAIGSVDAVCSNKCCDSMSCCASGSYCPGAVENELDRRLSQMHPKGPRLWPAPLN